MFTKEKNPNCHICSLLLNLKFTRHRVTRTVLLKALLSNGLRDVLSAKVTTSCFSDVLPECMPSYGHLDLITHSVKKLVEMEMVT